ncbi:MAG: NAD-dependent epimerase/dehydratase family protein [Candidatus Niyogibacteria bacterium]|nr:MAG: NAD-dependent epimerase/dehydratase family protein [Candidatus Niyogibacteria bacterium]
MAGKNKFLVTGGAGFIGSNLVKLLCDKGYNVFVLDDLSSGFRKLVDKRAKFYKGSISNRHLLRRILSRTDVVFHLAALSTITYSMTNPRIYFENNFMKGIILLEEMRRAGIKKMVYASSAASYDGTKKTPIKETDPIGPINPYGASKLAYEHAMSAYYHSFGIEGVALRFFNVYGPNDDQSNTTRAIPTWLKAALKGKQANYYWKGRQKRDYVFVEDLAEANLLAAKRAKGFKVYNVGSGKGYWMINIIKKIEHLLGEKLKLNDCGQRAGDPKLAIADILKIKRELGWRPRVSLEDGLQKTIDYYRKKPSRI